MLYCFDKSIIKLLNEYYTFRNIYTYSNLTLLYFKFNYFSIKVFKNSNNKYLGFTLLIVAVVGLNNWFWDIGMNPLIINSLDLFLWQFLYPLTYFLFFYKTSSKLSIKFSKLIILLFPFLVLSLLNTIISLSTTFNLLIVR